MIYRQPKELVLLSAYCAAAVLLIKHPLVLYEIDSVVALEKRVVGPHRVSGTPRLGVSGPVDLGAIVAVDRLGPVPVLRPEWLRLILSPQRMLRRGSFANIGNELPEIVPRFVPA